MTDTTQGTQQQGTQQQGTQQQGTQQQGTQQQGTQQQGTEPFYKPFNLDQPTIDYIEGKGIKDIGGLIKQAQDFERVARDRNVISKPDTSDPKKLAEWDGWEALGWVKDPAKYHPKQPTVKEGQVYDPEMFGAHVKLAHDLRIPVAAAEQYYQGMYDHMQERFATAAKAAGDKAAADTKALDTALRGKWTGDQYDANVEMAKRAARALGLGKEDTSEIEKITGSPRLLEIFHTIGSQLGEDTLAKGGNQGPGTTPEQARAQRLALEAKPEWLAIFQDQRHALHKQYVGDRQRLIDIEATKKAA